MISKKDIIIMYLEDLKMIMPKSLETDQKIKLLEEELENVDKLYKKNIKNIT